MYGVYDVRPWAEKCKYQTRKALATGRGWRGQKCLEYRGDWEVRALVNLPQLSARHPSQSPRTTISLGEAILRDGGPREKGVGHHSREGGGRTKGCWEVTWAFPSFVEVVH